MTTGTGWGWESDPGAVHISPPEGPANGGPSGRALGSADRAQGGVPGSAPERPTVVRSTSPRLTAAGGVMLATGAGLFGAVIDVLTGAGLRTLFSLFFIAGCVAAAALVRRHDLLATVVLPPLVYLLIALLTAAVEISGAAGSWVAREAFEAGTSLVVHAPTLVVATGLAAAVAWFRAKAGRVPTARTSPGRRPTAGAARSALR